MLHCVNKIGLSLQLQARNKNCLQRSRRPLYLKPGFHIVFVGLCGSHSFGKDRERS